MSDKLWACFLFTMILVLSFSCQSHLKFEKQKWQEREDIWYVNREKMLDDLLLIYHLKGMTVHNAITLLGPPDSHNNNIAVYKVSEEYDSDIDPTQEKDLLLFYSQDSIVIDVKVERWDK